MAYGCKLVHQAFGTEAITNVMDIKSKVARSQNMSAIRSKNTKPEIYLRKLLFAKGYRYRIAEKSIPGHPDILSSKI